MTKTKKMRQIKHRLLAGLFCISLLAPDLAPVLPVWAKEEAAVTGQIQNGENETAGTENPGSGNTEEDSSGNETLQPDGEDGKIQTESPAEDEEQNPQAPDDGTAGGDAQNPDSGNAGEGGQNPDDGMDSDDTPGPDGDAVEDTDPPGDGEEEGNADSDGVTDDGEEKPETSDGEDAVMDGAESVSDNSVSGNDMEAIGEVHALTVPADAIASGTYGNITWVIDADGKLTVEGTGDFAEPSTDPNNESAARNRVPWLSYNKQIKTAQIKVSGMTDASYMFSQCTNLTSIDLSGFDTGTVTNMWAMFSNCHSLKNLDVSGFHTENVTNMCAMFGSCRSLENLDVSGFDTKNVQNMSNMFSGLELKSLDLSKFDTSKVTRMDSMFSDSGNITELDLSSFDTGKVTDMSSMFGHCESLSKLDITSFNSGNVTKMSDMFNGCSNLTNLDLSHFNTAKVQLMDNMFARCSNLVNLNVRNFDTAQVINMRRMFSGCGLSSLDLSGFDTSRVTAIEYMFSDCDNLTSLDISNFDFSNALDLQSMFSQCRKLRSLNLGSDLNVSSATRMSGMFSSCTSLEEVDLSGMDASNVTRMNGMFSFCTSLKRVNLSGAHTEKVNDMQSMFWKCEALTDLDLTGFDTAEVTVMSDMFYDCKSLKTLDVSSFDTGKVTDMGSMFSNCNSLTSLDLSSFDLGAVPAHGYLAFLGGCYKLEIIYTPYNVAANSRLTLPTATGSLGDNVWYRSDNKEEITTLPEGLDHSILIARDKIPEAAARITARKTKTAYACGDKITVDDLTVTHYGADGSVRKLEAGQYTTNVEELNKAMTEAGEKKLVVTYQTGGVILTTEISLTVTYGLSASTATITLPAEGDYNYTYDGTPKTPGPITVTYTKPSAEGAVTSVTLSEGTDYAVFCRNNINAYEEAGAGGNADTASGADTAEAVSGSSAAAPTVIIRGIGKYSGTAEKTFAIHKAAAPPMQTKDVTASQCTQAQTKRAIDLAGSFAEYGMKTGYEVVSVDDPKKIFSKTPATADIRNGVLSYSTNAAQEGDAASIKIKVSFQNYQDAELTVKITMASKKAAVISGIVMESSTVYSGAPASYGGTASVKTEDGTDITGKVALVYRYSGTMADGTAYLGQDSGALAAPVNAGNYVLTVSVEDNNPDYMGSADYPFTIVQADAVVKAKDLTVLMQAQQGEGGILTPVEQYRKDFGYTATGLLNEDKLQKEPTYAITEDEAGTKAVTAIDLSKAGVYYIHPSGADAGMNYKIACKPGILTVSEERVAYTVTFDGMGRCDTFRKGGIRAGNLLELAESERKPAPKELGYVFAGWYRDRTFAKGTEWDFDKDTVQSDLTLYARWLTAAAEDGSGLKLCVQEIPDLAYTGSAQKPAVAVYGSDGITPLKEGKDYTVKYYRNTDAVKTGADGKPEAAGGTAKVTNPGRADEQITDVIGKFSKDCPYVAITGKGNYSETVYRNFMILPTDIAAEGEADNTPLAAGFTLKYTDQFEAKANKTAKIVSSLKYKKALKEGRDYSVSVTDESGQNIELTQGKLPLNAGGYILIVTGKGNYTGTVIRKLYVAEKQKLMKNASVTYAKTVKAENAEALSKGIEQTNIKVKIGGQEIPEDSYTVDYADTNHAVGTAAMILTGKNGYVGTKRVTFKITGVPFNAKTIDVKAYDDAKPGEPQTDAFRNTMLYTGKAVTQNKVALMTKEGQTPQELTCGEHYTITYKNHVNKGTASMTFTAKPESGYSGSFKKTFKITAQELSRDGIVILPLNISGAAAQEGNASVQAVYSKNGARLSLTVTNEAGTQLREGTDYTVKYKNNNAVTTAQTAENKTPCMTVTGKGNYVGKVEVPFTVIPASLSDAVEEGGVTVSCAQVQKKNGMKFKDFKFKLVEGKKTLSMGETKDYVIDETKCSPELIQAYAEALAVGEKLPEEPVVTVTGRGVYAGGTSARIPLGKYIYADKLTAAGLYVVVSEGAGQNVYTGGQVTPEVAVYYGDKTAVTAAKKDKATEETELTAENGKYKLKKLEKDADYTLSYGANLAAGKNKGSVAVRGTGRYGGSVTVKFTIEKKAIY